MAEFYVNQGAGIVHRNYCFKVENAFLLIQQLNIKSLLAGEQHSKRIENRLQTCRKRTHLTSINYGWAELGFFINSYREPTIALGYKTEVFETRRWRFHLMAGTAYGYKKKLYNYPTIPLSGTILFKTDFVPVGGATVEYFVSQKLSIKATFIPLVGGLGLQYSL